MKKIVTLALCFYSLVSFAQKGKIEFNKVYKSLSVTSDSSLNYKLTLDKGQPYRFTIIQAGVDVVVVLKKDTAVLKEQDSPNGKSGPEEFAFTPESTATYTLTIKTLEQNSPADTGKVSVYIKRFTKKEIETAAGIKKELEPENRKNVLTLDIDHFWEAYDGLKQCKTTDDSVETIQALYLDRGTDGLIDFAKVRSWSAERFVKVIGKYPKFFASICPNTYEVKKAEADINKVFNRFKEIYPNFKPFKVCFAIGLVNTGGTVSDNFLLIGTEVSTSTGKTDLSEFGNSAYAKMLAGDENFIQKIKNIVAHEAVHTQQNAIPVDSFSVNCPLLYSCIREGAADFIGELTSGSQINLLVHDYGNKHEKELWQQFKNELCNQNSGNWLYNYDSVKDKPGDLGYYMGYKIAQSYYEHAADKKQAVADIVEMNNPLLFLQASEYDKKMR